MGNLKSVELVAIMKVVFEIEVFECFRTQQHKVPEMVDGHEEPNFRDARQLRDLGLDLY